ncbi:MAG: adenosylcobinamide-GDP ribazoletransferase [Eubacterium sp.]|nr:adenosylcobinamide-GDP ribazoletransferase [Eubacterium sp.]
MKLLKSCVLAFSYYTKIPMPELQYGEHDGDYMFCFFPLIGILIGAAEALWLKLAASCGTGILLEAAVAVAIPVLITGGIHLDGLLDASDAIASWKSREERLAIMHDTHTGAFAVITCAVFLMLALGGASDAIVHFPGAVWFIFSSGRIFTALLVVFEKPAGRSGMLYTCTKQAAARSIVVSTVLYLCLLTGIALKFGILLLWVKLAAAGVVVLAVYTQYIRKKFGGITGDLAGCFLSVYELVLVMTAAFLH